jgi:nucleoid-associated protein YgaU
MKTRIGLLCVSGVLAAVVSGCTSTELSQTPLSPAESQWAEYMSYSYPQWKPPRTVPPSSNAVTGETIVIQEPLPVPETLTPAEQAPAPLAPVKDLEKKTVEAQKYTIQKGDTLSMIAKKLYGQASKWNVILDANKDKISDAGKLKVGMTIDIPAQ